MSLLAADFEQGKSKCVIFHRDRGGSDAEATAEIASTFDGHLCSSIAAIVY